MNPLSDADIDAASSSSGPLTDAQIDAGSKPAGPSKWESFGRGMLSGATFDFDDEIGVSDRAAKKAAQEANPWTHFLGELVGGVAPMSAAALLPTGATQVAAGARATNLAQKGLGLVRTALVPGEVKTVGQSVKQGLKLGATYGGLSGAGHADTDAGDTTAEALTKRGAGAASGLIAGGLLGGPLGAAGYGASKLIGAGLNKILPDMQEAAQAAKAPEAQGVKDIMRAAMRDGYTAEDIARVQAEMADPTQAHRYAGLNIIEALEAKKLAPVGPAGELKPPVAVSPNLSDLAQDFANTAGAGRQEAMQKFATRKAEMSANIQQDIDRLFGQDTVALGDNLATTIGRSIPSKLDDIQSLPGLIDRHLGSGTGEASDAALAAQKAALSKRYEKLKSKPLQAIDDLGQVAQRVPAFQKALDYAAENDMIRLAGSGADWSKSVAPWSKGDLGQTILTLSPTNILDIHHALVMAAKPPITGHTPESVMAGKLKNWFSGWVDRQFKGHEPLRRDYAAFRQTMEAREQAAKLGAAPADATHPALQFFNKIVGERDRIAQAVAKQIDSYDRSVARYQAGQIKRLPAKAPLATGEAAITARNAVIEEFRAAWGEAIKQDLAQSTNPAALVKRMLTPAGQKQIMTIAGEQQGSALINSLMVMEARNQGLALGLKAGGADHQALQFLQQAAKAGRADVVNAFRQAWGDRIKQELASADGAARVVRDLTTQEGKARILKILGPEDGKQFIESLYNKAQQLGLGQRLYGGPDTAYKLARNKKKDAIMDAAYALRPWSPSPVDLWNAMKTIGSARLAEARADRGNRLLSQQGPDELGKVIDAIMARYQLQTVADPYVLKPFIKGVGPAAGTIPGLYDQSNASPGLQPYKP